METNRDLNVRLVDDELDGPVIIISVDEDKIVVKFPVNTINENRGGTICTICPFNGSTHCLDECYEDICTKVSAELGEFDWYPEISGKDMEILKALLKRVLWDDEPGIIKKKRTFKRSAPY